MRILVSAFGSAGDLFPLVPVMDELTWRGHEVRCAVPRGLSLYLRSSRVPLIGLGDGSEMRAPSDQALVTTRFDGWVSWRRLMDVYVVPTLSADAMTLKRVIQDWRPDVVAAGTMAVAARVAARTCGVPLLDMYLGPRPADASGSRHFAPTARDAVAALLGLDPSSSEVGRATWGGAARRVLLHDAALLGEEWSDRTVGFPYWDFGPERQADVERTVHWLQGSRHPTVLVSLGSFLGSRQLSAWTAALSACEMLEARALMIGAPGNQVDRLESGRDDRRAAGFVRLSRLIPHVDTVIHHGGIGTLFGTLRAGRPAVVLPQAFDQPFNARLLEQRGLGFDATQTPLTEALDRALHDQHLRAQVKAIAAQLTDRDTATRQASEAVLETAQCC